MDALQFFLARHQALHAATEGGVLDGLSEAQWRTPPRAGVNSLVWLLWHIAHAEDGGASLATGRPMALAEDDWLRRLGIPRRVAGTGMGDDEVRAFSEGVDLAALRDYWRAVGEHTRAAVASLDAAELDRPMDPEQVREAVRAEGLYPPAVAERVERFFASRTRGDLLGHLGLTHSCEHWGEAQLVATLLRAG